VTPDRTSIEHAIDGVLDPCSRFNGTNLSFVELGMIDEIRIGDDGHVLIKLWLDDPTCLYLAVIRRELREAVSEVEGVEQVEFEVVWDRIWTEEQLDERGRAKLAASRAAKREKLIQLTPLSRS
jgi:metal-sulfur cluster biosynthetic enzyme